MFKSCKSTLALSLIAMFPVTSLAANLESELVFENPIDPDDRVTDVASGATPQADLEALPGFGAIQDFVGATAGTNVFYFDPETTDGHPDVRTSITGGTTSGGDAIANYAFTTSPGTSLRLDGSGWESQSVFTIEFGAFDQAAETFAPSARGVIAAGFTLAGERFREGDDLTIESITVQFQNSDGTVLSEQTTGPTSGGGQLYFGHLSDDDLIHRIEIIVDWLDETEESWDYKRGPIGVDDIGFAVPEPASLGLLSLAGLLVFSRRHRRR